MSLAKLVLLNLVSLAFFALLSGAQKSKKMPVSSQDILSVLSQQPVPDQVPQNNQMNVAKPVLNVEPLPSKTVTGVDVMASLQAACQSLQSFISRSQFVKQQMSMMSPSLLPWFYAQKSGFPTECSYSSYSNALNVFATACNVFETCPLPTPVMDLGTMMPSFAANFEMPFDMTRGLGLPMVVPRPVVLRPQAPSLTSQSLPATKPTQQGMVSRRKVQRRPQQAQRPQIQQRARSQTKGIHVVTKVAPKPPMVVQSAVKAVTQIQQPVKAQQTFQRMPIPSMASMYPMWFYRFGQLPTLGNSVGAKATTPRPGPDHDGTD